MNCFECANKTEIKKYKAYQYNRVGLDNLVLLDAEVMFCPNCKEENLMLKQIDKIHSGIGIAIALQPARLTGSDIKFLRRSSDINVADWSSRIGTAESTYSKWENNHRTITEQADRLARVNFLEGLIVKGISPLKVVQFIAQILTLRISEKKNFIIGVYAENPIGKGCKYLPVNSPVLSKPSASVVQAQLAAKDRLTVGRVINAETTTWVKDKSFENCLRGAENVGKDLTFAA